MVRLQDYSVTEVHVLLGFQKSGPWLSSVFRGIAEKQLLNTKSGTKKKKKSLTSTYYCSPLWEKSCTDSCVLLNEFMR